MWLHDLHQLMYRRCGFALIAKSAKKYVLKILDALKYQNEIDHTHVYR